MKRFCHLRRKFNRNQFTDLCTSHFIIYKSVKQFWLNLPPQMAKYFHICKWWKVFTFTISSFVIIEKMALGWDVNCPVTTFDLALKEQGTFLFAIGKWFWSTPTQITSKKGAVCEIVYHHFKPWLVYFLPQFLLQFIFKCNWYYRQFMYWTRKFFKKICGL